MITPENDGKFIDIVRIQLLQKLGVLDENCDVTPEGFIGFITRMPVNEQAQALGLPLILLPPHPDNRKPEAKVVDFFSKDKKLSIYGGFGESYLLRSFISSVVGEFEERKRKHKISKEQIDLIATRVLGYSESDIIHLIEKNNVVFQRHFGWVYSIEYPPISDHESYFPKDLISRFSKCTYYKLPMPPTNDQEQAEIDVREYLLSKTRAKQYAKQMLDYLYVWRSLTPQHWARFIRMVLTHWDKMSTGWPDINIVSPHGGLVLIEVKGKDKLHTSQIFTLLKLREVLGPERVAIAWVNRVARDLSFDNSKHRASALEWINTPSHTRTNSLLHPKGFYDLSKSKVF